MEVTVAFDVDEARRKSWQSDFPETTECCRCKGNARLGFVAHEGFDVRENPKRGNRYVCQIYENGGEGDCWLHDYCAVAVYFCKQCLEPTALYNQA